MGYNLTKQEIKWVNKIKKRADEDLMERNIQPDYDNVLTTAILGVTLFTRKLKLVKKNENKIYKS